MYIKFLALSLDLSGHIMHDNYYYYYVCSRVTTFIGSQWMSTCISPCTVRAGNVL